jgi:hypothetical protein
MNKSLYDYYSVKIPAQFKELKNSIKYHIDENLSPDLIATSKQIEDDMFHMGLEWDGKTLLPVKVETAIWDIKDPTDWVNSKEYISLAEKFKTLYDLVQDSITSANIEVSLLEQKFEEEYSFI